MTRAELIAALLRSMRRWEAEAARRGHVPSPAYLTAREYVRREAGR